MAIQKHPREDLLNEATAYRRRVLLSVPKLAREQEQSAAATGLGCSGVSFEELFAGQRKSGGWSLYFDQDTVLQLSTAGRLRRLFWRDRKFAAQDGAMSELSQQQLGGRIRLGRNPLSSHETSAILENCLELVQLAHQLLQSDGVRITGQIPPEDRDIMPEVQAVLARLRTGILLADHCDAH